MKKISRAPQFTWSNSFKTQEADMDDGIRKLNKSRDKVFSLNGAWSY